MKAHLKDATPVYRSTGLDAHFVIVVLSEINEFDSPESVMTINRLLQLLEQACDTFNRIEEKRLAKTQAT